MSRNLATSQWLTRLREALAQQGINDWRMREVTPMELQLTVDARHIGATKELVMQYTPAAYRCVVVAREELSR